MFRCRFAGLLFLVALPVWAQPCEAPPNVKAAIDAAAARGKPLEERTAAAGKIRDQFPSDYYAHRFYQELFVANGVFSQAVRDEYKALLDAHPGDLMYQMLYARTLKGSTTREAISLLDKMLERQPDYALAHLKLVEIYSAPVFRDAGKLQAHAEAYWKGCPSSLSGYTYVTHIDDADFMGRTAARLRNLLAGRSDNEALGLYGTLWALEFRAVPLSGQDPTRERIRRDAAMLREVDTSKHPYMLSELGQAYQMLGDKDGAKWVSEHMPRRTAPLGNPAMEAINQWRRDHPFKAADREAWNDALLKQTEEWIRLWPDEPQPRYERFTTLERDQSAPLDDAVKAAEEWLRVYEAHPAFMSPYMQVAQFYSRQRIRYGELPGLVEKALKEAAPTAPPTAPPAPVSDLYPPRSQPFVSRPNNSRVHHMSSAADIYIRIKKYDRARELLAQLEPALTEALNTAPEAEKQSLRFVEYMYWNNVSQLARIEGHKLEALVAQRNAFRANPSSNPQADEYQKTSLREAWKELNGGDAGFEAWMAEARPNVTPAAPPAPKTPPPAVANTEMPWTALAKPLPDFQMSDAGGKTWRLADLKGKVTLVNLWATWCGPCRTELPYLEKLFNKVRDRKDLTVLTLNTDDNLGLILPFLQENKYTFPVLPAAAYVDKLVPELSIPRNWIVDADGVLRQERIGFGPGGDKWVDEMIASMEKARPEKK